MLVTRLFQLFLTISAQIQFEKVSFGFKSAVTVVEQKSWRQWNILHFEGIKILLKQKECESSKAYVKTIVKTCCTFLHKLLLIFQYTGQQMFLLAFIILYFAVGQGHIIYQFEILQLNISSKFMIQIQQIRSVKWEYSSWIIFCWKWRKQCRQVLLLNDILIMCQCKLVKGEMNQYYFSF